MPYATRFQKWIRAGVLLFMLVSAIVPVALAAESEETTADSQNPLAKAPVTSSTVQNIKEEAFAKAVQNTLPMSPEQIVKLRQLFNQNQAASQAYPGTPPRPTVSSQLIKLEPGATPVVIRLAQGYVSTLAFLDSTGQPWPLSNYALGNPEVFNIKWDHKSNLLMIQSSQLYYTSNLVVRLHNLPTPIVLTLVSGQKAIDYRVDLQVSGFGPNAKTLLGRSLPRGTDPALLGVLDGIPPSESVILKVSGGPAQAWLVGKKIFVRTRLTLLSPAWISTLSSLDGMKAYEIPKASFILASENGRSIQLKLEGFLDHYG